jgi:hypothetical protein
VWRVSRAVSLPAGQFAFYALFVGFFFYHQAADNELIPRFLGGYFGVVSVFVSLLLGAKFVLRLSSSSSYSIKLSVFDFSFFLLLFFIVSVAAINYVIGDLAGRSEMLLWSISGVFFNLVVYMIGRSYEFSVANSRLMLLTGAVMLAVVYLNSVDGRFYVWRPYVDDNTPTYQGYGRSLVLVGFLLIAYSRNIAQAVLTSAAFIPALFLNGGRTEFILFIVSFLCLLAYSVARMRYGLIGLLAMSFIIISAGLLLAPTLQSILPDSRILELFELSISSSALERAHLTDVALATVSQNPLLGDYGSYFITESGVGSYAHNLLSAWVNLGFLGFMGYAILVGSGLVVLLRLGRTPNVRHSGPWRLALLLSVYMLLAYVLSRNYLDELFGFFVGVLASCQQRSTDTVRTPKGTIS